MEETNLDYLFIDQVPNFAHLIPAHRITKEDFMKKVKSTYSLENPKTDLFYQSCNRSTFETIRYDRLDKSIKFNH